MAIGVFDEKNVCPTMDQVSEALGLVRAYWEEINAYLGEGCRAKGEWRFYGKNYGWALRFVKSGKALVSLYPQQDGFVVQMVLNETVVEASLDGQLKDVTRQAIERAHPYPEGRWVYLRIGTEDELDDVRTLLSAKLSTAKKAKSR